MTSQLKLVNVDSGKTLCTVAQKGDTLVASDPFYQSMVSSYTRKHGKDAAIKMAGTSNGYWLWTSDTTDSSSDGRSS